MIAKSYEIERNPKKFSKYNLFLLYGENIGLKKDIKEKIEKFFIEKGENAERISFYENEILLNEDNFYNHIYSGSLFGEKKIIIINDGKDKINKQIKDIIDKYPDNIKIIVYADTLDKKSSLRKLFEENDNTLCIPCYLDGVRDLETIASNTLKEKKISLSRESINLLIEKSNFDRINLNNEIEKIISFSLDKKEIEIDELKSLINFTGEHKSDILINECLSGNILQYKKILEELYLNTVNQIFLLRILSQKIQRLLSMKEMEKKHNNIDVIISTIKPPIFWKEKPQVKKQLSVWNMKDLKTINHEINNIELSCKKNSQISKIIFFNFFNKICSKANSFS
mgnify:CR=1 FL=1